MSAPRSTIPCGISKTKPVSDDDAYASATSASIVVLMNAPSMPPLTPNSLASQNSLGSTRPEMPR